MSRSLALMSCCFAVVCGVQVCDAHEGEEHRDAAAVSVAPSAGAALELPRRLENGDLYIPKPVQRLLGIRTEVFASVNAKAQIQLQGEIAARPEKHVVTSAPQAGVLEAPEGGWPLPGATVKAGQVLAYLQPQMTQRDTARRVAQAADYEQKSTIAEINSDRLQLQAAATEGQLTAGNVYYEQAVAELDAVKQQHEEVSASLSDRLPLRAAASGVLLRNNQRSGERVVAGQAVFEVTNPTQLRVIAYSFDPRMATKLRSANLLLEGRRIPLRLRGQEPLVGQPGWRLLLDLADGDANLSPGMPVKVELGIAGDFSTQQLARACVISGANVANVWVHVDAERFSARRVSSCDSSVASGINQFKPGDRLVVAGGASLAQYH